MYHYLIMTVMMGSLLNGVDNGTYQLMVKSGLIMISISRG